MPRLKKYILLAVSVLLMGAIAAGVALYTASYDPDNPDPGLYLNGQRVLKPEDVVLSVGGHAITYAEYRYYYHSAMTYNEQSAMYSGGTIDWADDPDGDLALELRESVELNIKMLCTWLDVAKERGIELTEEEKADIQAELDGQREAMGEEGLLQDLRAAYILDEATCVMLLEKRTLAQKAQTAYTDEVRAADGERLGEEADGEFAAANISAKHILFMAMTDEEYAAMREAKANPGASSSSSAADSSASASMTEDEQAAYAAQAQYETEQRAAAMLAEITASEDPAAAFDEAMNEYSEDTGLAANPGGYTFPEGQMVPEFDSAARALAEGEISEPVWHDGAGMGYSGYHIIMRIPLSEEALSANRETAITAKVTEMTGAYYDERSPALAVNPCEYYARITPTDVL